MQLPIFVVDAFTKKPFSGNPAAVIPLQQWLDDSDLQRIAAENNLSETAFFAPCPDLDLADYTLRWFTPKCEVDLCGHATLACAHILWQHLGVRLETIRFSSQSGVLTVRRDENMIILNFPAYYAVPRPMDPSLEEAMGLAPKELLVGKDWLLVYENEDQVNNLSPDMSKVEQLQARGIIASAPAAPGQGDFVSRFFAPSVGVSEDPVTGSAHCTSVPFWAQRLKSPQLVARQISQREGTIYCEFLATDHRVLIGGHAFTYSTGTIFF